MKPTRERGMTLVEVVVAVALTGVIVPALTGAVLLGMRTLDNTNRRLAGSNDTLLIASYFTSDVEGASYAAKAGTRAHVSPSVVLPVDLERTVLVTAYALTEATTVLAPPTGGTVWNASAGQLTSSLADELLLLNEDNRGDTTARVATTPVPLRSLAHTVALVTTPGDVLRKGETHGAVADGSSLSLSKPAAAAADDVLIAHITATTSGANVPTPDGWTLISERNSGAALTSLVYTRVAASLDTSWTWQLAAGAGTRSIAGGIAAYSRISTATPVLAHAVAANPCGGNAPVLSITTADNLAIASTSYFVEADDTEHTLVRKTCEGDGITTTRQVLARELQDANAATISCEPVECDSLPATVSLTVREPPLNHETRSRYYTLSARTRTG